MFGQLNHRYINTGFVMPHRIVGSSVVPWTTDERVTRSSNIRVDSTPGVRCNEKPITQSHRNFFHRENGVYKIDAGAGEVIVYCVLSDSHGCGGGYTLVMKIDGNEASVRIFRPMSHESYNAWIPSLSGSLPLGP